MILAAHHRYPRIPISWSDFKNVIDACYDLLCIEIDFGFNTFRVIDIFIFLIVISIVTFFVFEVFGISDDSLGGF